MANEKKKPTMEEYLSKGKITKELYDTVSVIPNKDKQKRVIALLGKRLEKRGVLR